MNFWQSRRGAVTLSLVSNCLLALAKLAAALATGSVGLLSEALHSGVDLIASGVAFVAVRKAEAPPDASYRFGHGKWESLSGVVEGGLILLASGFILREAWQKWSHPEPIQNFTLAMLVLGASILVNLLVTRHLEAVGKREKSTAILVDAEHLRSDVVSSSAVLVGLLLVKWTGRTALDALAGAAVGTWVVWVGLKAMRASTRELLDRSLPKEEAVVRRILDAHLPQIISYHDLRSRRVGALSHFEIHLVMAGDQTVERAHDFCDHLEQDIREAVGDVHIAIHVEPPSEQEAAARDQRRRPRPPENLSPRDILARELPGRLPGPVLDVARTLKRSGHQAWLVGGAPRDVLLGRPTPADWDIATDARPERIIELFGPDVLTHGLKHGTVTVINGSRVSAEVSTFRADSEYTDARHPDHVTFVDTIEQDLSRRDFTVNAMAFDPEEPDFRDPHGGWEDLRAGILRAVGDPIERFQEDGLRPVRAARFAAQLDFALEEETLEAIPRVRERVAMVAMERVREELQRLVVAEWPRRGFAVLDRTGLLEDLLPELAEGRGVYQNRHHAYDVFAHSLATLENAPREKPRVRWAALLHDIGKPRTKVIRDGEGTFYDHQAVGADLADGLLKRLRFSNAEREDIVHLIREHMFDYRAEWSDAALRRFVRRVGREHLADLFDLRIADTLGNGLKQGFPHYLEEMHARIEDLLRLESALAPRDLALNGEDIMRVLGIPPGRQVGAAQEMLLDVVLEDPARNRPEILEELLRAHREKLLQA